MVKVRFSGGLGNQLYQLAFLLFLQTKGIKAVPDFCEFTYYSFHKGLELNKVLHTAYDGQINEIEQSRNNWYLFFNPKLGFWLRFHYYRLKNKYVDRLVMEDVNAVFDINQMKNTDHLILKGHWQRLEYVDAVKGYFLQYLNYDYLSSERDRNIVKQIRNTDSVSIHIRRGDYLKESQYYVIRSFDYYNNAIELIKESCADVVFYVFSDDIMWTKANIKEKNVVFIDWNSGADSFKDLLLMSLCQHNIIANSTFSWWGAYLNANPDKIVICPDHWLVGEKSTDRIPVDWIQLEV